MSERELNPLARRARQKRTLTVLAVLLLAMGIGVLFFLQRMPLPLRLLIGLGDVFAGMVLLVFVRPRFGP